MLMKLVHTFLLLVWCIIVGCETPNFGSAPKVRDALAIELNNISDSPLYKVAAGRATTGGTPYSIDEKESHRNELLRVYIIKIQHYHQTVNDDIYTNTAVYGTGLDVLALAAASIATAVVPAATKTWWSAVAAFSSGTKLAASKNIFQEKNINAILNVMVEERSKALTVLYTGMKQRLADYPVDVALVDLDSYFNSGGLETSAARAEALTGKAREEAALKLEQVQPLPQQ